MELETLNDLRWYRLTLKKFEIKIAQAFNIFRSNNIEPILIKGWAAARNYPETKSRYFTDVDLAVRESDYQAAAEICSRPEVMALDIDLHREFRHLENVAWDEIFSRSQLVNVENTTFRILGPEDHLRLMCVHWLADGGAYRERLWDIYYTVENRPDNFDWDLSLDAAGQVRRGWVICTIGLAHKYLGLDLDKLPFQAEAKPIPQWVIKCVEREWRSKVKLRAFRPTSYRKPKEFLQQILKRIPPNPIQATVEMEGRFDNSSRLPIQIANFYKRIGPLLKRNLSWVFRK